MPVAVDTSGVLSGKFITAIAASMTHTLALDSDGKVYSWGSNQNQNNLQPTGQLGDGTNVLYNRVPVAVSTSGVLSGKTITAIAASEFHSLACASDGTVYAWGGNYYGMLGDGTTTRSLAPVSVTTSGVLAGKTITAVASSYLNSLALASDGTMYAWGYGNGANGNGSGSHALVPVAVSTSGVLAGKSISAITCGYSHCVALSTDGGLYAWGAGSGGALGNNSIYSSGVPVLVNMTPGLSALAGATVLSLGPSSSGNTHVIATSSLLAAPDAPLDITAVVGASQATVSFTAPPSTGGATIISYLVTASPGNVTAAGTVSPLTITGLTNGVTYTFTVAAINAIGTGAASVTSNAVTPPVPYRFATFAGAGSAGSLDGTGTAAQFNLPSSTTVDSGGTLYVADSGTHTIRQISSAGIVTTFAGSGIAGATNATGSSASFNAPTGVAVDSTGTVYVADAGNHVIRKITSSGIVTTLAGSGSAGAVNATGTSASFNTPTGVAVDDSGNVFVADSLNHIIRKITSGGVVTTYAGYGYADWEDSNNGDYAFFDTPTDLALDADGNLYIADAGNNAIRKITPSRAVTTLAGYGWSTGWTDATGQNARFNHPTGVAVDGAGNVFVADKNNYRIRKVTSGGVVTTIGGSGSSGSASGVGSAATFNHPADVAVNASGTLYVADYNNHTIRTGKLMNPPTDIALSNASVNQSGGTNAALGTLSTTDADSGDTHTYSLVAGTGDTDNALFDISGSTVRASNAGSLASGVYSIRVQTNDGNGESYQKTFAITVVDDVGPTLTSITRQVPSTQTARTNTVVFTVTFNSAVTITGKDFFVVTPLNGGTTTGTVSSVTGGPSVYQVTVDLTGGAGDFRLDVTAPNTPPVTFSSGFNNPTGVVTDGDGNVYAANYDAGTVTKMTSGGVISIFATGFSHPHGLAFDSVGDLYVSNEDSNTVDKVTTGGVVSLFATGFQGPWDLEFDANGNLYVTNWWNGTVSKVTTGGSVSTFAAGFGHPYGLAFDGAGNLYVSDANDNSVSKVTSGGVVSPFATGFDFSGGLAFDSAGNLYVTNLGNDTISKVTAAGLVTTFATGLSRPSYLAVDFTDMLFITNATNNTLTKLLGAAIIDAAGNSLTGLPYSGGEHFTYDPNDTPTDITLSHSSVNQSAAANATVGTLSTTDADGGDTHTYALVAGAGGTDNALFTISGSTLRATNPAALAGGNYSVRLQTDDAHDGIYAKVFVLTVVDDVAPIITSSALANDTYGISGFNYTITATGSALSFSASGLPAGLLLNVTTGAITGTPAQAGLFQITVGASDAAGNSGTAQLALTIKQTITFDGPADQAFSAAPITLVASAASGLPVSFSVVSGPASVAGSSLTLTGAGSVVIRASQAGDATYLAATDVDRTLNIGKAAQAALSITSQGSGTFNTVYVATSAGGSGAGIVTWSLGTGSTAPGAAIDASAGVMTSSGVGTVVIRVTKGPDDNYLSRSSPDFTVTLAKAAQTISFAGPVDRVFSPLPIELFATSGSGLPVGFSVVSGPAVINGSTLTLNGFGSVVIRASQAGNVNYAAAVNVDRAITSNRRLSVREDFNGDGMSDILWTNTVTGDRAMWFMKVDVISTNAFVSTVPVDWSVSGTGDFNGDGKADILWTNTLTGDRAMWLMDGNALIGGDYLGAVPVEWVASGTGDFNGDGKSDIFWTNTATGERSMWLMDGVAVIGGASLGVVPVAWIVNGTGDFDGDGKADVMLSNTVTGDRVIWFMNGTTISTNAFAGTVPVAWIVGGVGDFDGDGKSDIFWTNTATGDRAVWLMNASTASAGGYLGQIPTAWTVSSTGDYNGDGKADIFWTNTATGERSMWLMNGITVGAGASLGVVPLAWVPAN